MVFSVSTYARDFDYGMDHLKTFFKNAAEIYKHVQFEIREH